MVLASLAEVASIGAVLPFLGALMAPERVFFHPMAQPIVISLGLTEPSKLISPLTILFILAGLFSGAMRLILLWAQTRIGFSLGADFSSEIYQRTLFQPFSVHVSRNSSQVISVISIKTDFVINNYLLPMLFIISSSLILVTVLGVLIAINPIIAMTTFGGFGALYFFITFSTKKWLVKDSQNISKKSDQVIRALQEGLGGIRDILINGTQATYCKVYSKADLSLRKSQANIQIIAGAPRFIIEALGIALIALIAYRMAEYEGGVSNAVPMLGAIALSAQRLFPVLQLIYSSWAGIRSSTSSVQDVIEFLNQPMEESPEYFIHDSMAFDKSIILKDVKFNYLESSPLIIQGIDIEIPKGARVGFIGATGAGKSTLLDLIMGLLQPTHGILAVDNIRITKQNCRYWQAKIAHVPQSIFLADATIAQNIAFGILKEKIDYEKVRTAARKAQIETTIESWDKKYDTLVGERGIRLSGGQRQRIGIARALYKNANVIVFDEATSALDNETEKNVMQAIECISADITILIVAHRLSTLQKCDLVFELSQGKILRSGTYAEIISQIEKNER